MPAGGAACACPQIGVAEGIPDRVLLNPLTGKPEYTGSVIRKAWRIMELAMGCQVLFLSMPCLSSCTLPSCIQNRALAQLERIDLVVHGHIYPLQHCCGGLFGLPSAR